MANIPKDVAYVMKQMGIKTWDAFKDLMKGPLAKQLGGELERYRSGKTGPASSQSVESGAEGTVRPTREDTFAGVPARIVSDDPETFAGSGFVPIPTQKGIVETKPAAQQKSSSTYSRSTALKDAGGELLTEEGISNLEDADVSDRYKVFFGADPKDASTARSELLELFKSFNKAKNPLLD